MDERPSVRFVAEQLVELYDRSFGGKERGRYRVSMKHMKMLTGRKRIPGPTIRKIGEELFEQGYVLIDLESYFVVMDQRTFRSYRRVNDSCVDHFAGAFGHA